MCPTWLQVEASVLQTFNIKLFKRLLVRTCSLPWQWIYIYGSSSNALLKIGHLFFKKQQEMHQSDLKIYHTPTRHLLSKPRTRIDVIARQMASRHLLQVVPMGVKTVILLFWKPKSMQSVNFSGQHAIYVFFSSS